MPSEKKRVNLTIPDEVYDRLQDYKKKYGISSDAGACLQLIIRQLDGQANTEKMIEMVSKFSMEELQHISGMGFKAIKEFVNPEDETE